MFLKETCAGNSGVDITTRAAPTGQAWTGVTWDGLGSPVLYPVVTTGLGTIRPRDAAVVAIVRSEYAPPAADHAVRFKVKVASYMGAAVVYLRMTPGVNFSGTSQYVVQADATSGSSISWTANKTVNNSGSLLGPAVTQAGVSVGDTLDCTATISGSTTVTIVLRVNGSTVGTWTDSSSTLTAPGTPAIQFYHNATPGDSVGLQFALLESPAEATAFAIGGVPGTVNVGSAITGTVTPNAPVGQSESVAVADDQGHTLATLTFALGDTAGKGFSSTATSGQAGTRTLTATASPALGTAPTATTTVTNAPATAYTLTAPATAHGFSGNPSGAFVVQCNGVPNTSLVVTPHDTSGGSFSPPTLTITDAGPQNLAYTPSSPGAKTITVTHTGGSGISGDPAGVSYTSDARTLVATPSALPPSATTSVAFAGGGTRWLTSPPTITASGGVTLGPFSATADAAGSAAVTTPSSIGSFTYTDSTDASTAAGAVASVGAYSSSFDFGAGYAGMLGAVGYTLISRATQTAVGSRVTAGIAISATDGSVSAVGIVADPSTPFDVRWDTGGSAPTYGIDPYPLAASGSAGGATAAQVAAAVAAIMATSSVGGVNTPVPADVVRVNGQSVSVGDGVATGATSTTITIPSQANLKDWTIRILSATTGADQSRVITASNTGTGVQTVDSAWSPTPTGTIVCEWSQPKVLAASQTAYAPSKAGDAMTLTGAYDAARTAAQAATALTNATWTDARAANIDAAISTRSTFAGGAVASVTSPVALTSAYDPAKTAAQASALGTLVTAVGAAGAGLTAIPDTSGMSALLSRLSPARALYIDNLAAGPVAQSGQIPTAFTASTFSSPGIFAPAALAAAPTGTGTAASGATLVQLQGELDARGLTSTTTTKIDAAVSTRLAGSAYTAPPATVTLAASQPNFTPARAGDPMTLTSAYDPAKTAAQAGALSALSTNVGGPAQASALSTLSAAVGSPAQASTALSTATWTNQKAAYLDSAVSAAGGASPSSTGAFPTAIGTVVGTPTTTTIAITGNNLLGSNGAYTGRRLYCTLGTEATYLTTVGCTAHTVSGGGSSAVHTFTFATPQKLVAVGDTMAVAGY